MPAVAGQFYPGQKNTLMQSLSDFCEIAATLESAIGVISPHAGYMYSGSIAGQLFSRIDVPDKVILLGPNHHGVGHPGAVYPAGSWVTPLGNIAIDKDLEEAILSRCARFSVDESAHRFEHSLEVQVPFIQYRNPHAEFVPICIGQLQLDSLIECGEALAGVIASCNEPVLMIASSDMTHFEPSDAARKKDFMALEQVEHLNPEGLYRTVHDHRISMCGVRPSVVMLAASRKLGAEDVELVAYGNSGDVTGDYADVVGYAGVIVR